jgi:hypothetical protein
LDGYTLRLSRVVSPENAEAPRSLCVSRGKIAAKAPAGAPSVDLGEGYHVYPALINVHDHLRGNYQPRVGPHGDSYYVNWSYWDNDLKTSEVYAERSNITPEQMYRLSAYKNLFSGVATVNDHFPHEINEPFIPKLPVRVIREYTLAHECSSFDLKWGKGIEPEFHEAIDKNWPFITHLEEGFDPESQAGVDILERLGCLDDHNLLIHCIGFSESDIQKVAKAKAHVAWCPASNMFMFNVTCKVRKMLKAGINVSIGTDSTHTGSANLLEEMRFARQTYRDMYGEDLSAKTLMAMVTTNPAKAFRMDDRIGALEEGMLADILALRARSDDPWEDLASARMEDIALLTLEGEPLLCEEGFGHIARDAARLSRVNIGGRPMLVAGKPRELLAEIRSAVGFEKVLTYLPFSA